MMMTRMVTLMVTMVMMAIQVTMIDKPAYLVIRFLFGFTSDSDSQTQQKYQQLVRQYACLMMDGDEGYDVDEEKYDIEDCRCPSKVSLIVMMILFMTVNDNFDDDEKVEPGNYVGHEPHSESPLQVAGGTITPCMVIVCLIIIIMMVILIIMMPNFIITIIIVMIMTDHNSLHDSPCMVIVIIILVILMVNKLNF